MDPAALAAPSRGPLAVDVGLVTGAVDDLVSGYESLVQALPDVAHRVSQIQNGTEDMAKRLEVLICLIKLKDPDELMIILCFAGQDEVPN